MSVDKGGRGTEAYLSVQFVVCHVTRWLAIPELWRCSGKPAMARRGARRGRVSVISGARQGGQGGAGGHTREPTTEAHRAVQRANKEPLFSPHCS